MNDRRPDDDAELAARPFPSEAEWLDLPLPTAAELGWPSDRDAAASAFVDRIVEVIRDERALDQAIAAEDKAVPRILLATHTPPPPSADFIARTVGAVHNDRRARWQRLLARYVSPEPTPQFVARTLAALGGDRSKAPPARAPLASRWPWFLAAAAVLFALFVWRLPGEASWEVRLAEATTPAFAHRATGNSLALLLVENERRREPDALTMASADGVWLLLGDTPAGALR